MGLLDSVFGGGSSDTSFSTIPEEQYVKDARNRLIDLSNSGMPNVPLQGVADTPTREQILARDTATQMAQPTDIFSLPEVQGVIQKTMQEGNLLANRLSRSLQLSGNLTSTPGRDVLGRAVSDVQSNLSASLADFANQERNRRVNLIPVLESLGQADQATQQNKLNALFNQQTTQSNQTQSYLIPLLQTIMGSQPGVTVDAQEPSIFSQISPLLSTGIGAWANSLNTKTLANALGKV
jgi:hypothetical protein